MTERSFMLFTKRKKGSIYEKYDLLTMDIVPFILSEVEINRERNVYTIQAHRILG